MDWNRFSFRKEPLCLLLGLSLFVIILFCYKQQIGSSEFQLIQAEAENTEAPSTAPHSTLAPKATATDHKFTVTVRNNTEKTQPKQTKLLLVTYFRGGSSFLGQMFNQNNEVFYWYEPYASIYNEEFKMKRHYVDVTGNSLFLSDDGFIRDDIRGYTNTSYSLTEDIFNCNISKIDKNTLKHNFITNLHRSRNFERYLECVTPEKHEGKTDEEKFSTETVYKCRVFITPECTNSSFRVIKTIRTPMHLVEEFLKRDSDLKVLYYLRDPRGMLNSRLKIRFSTGAESEIVRTCALLKHDWLTAQGLMKNYSDRIKVLKYETLASDPLDSVEDVYRFIGESLPNQVVNWVRENTQGEFDSAWGTTRNSTKTKDKWRTELKLKQRHLIESLCMETLQLVGYED